MPTPEARREERAKFDRHPAYVYFHAGVWLVALGIMLADAPSASAVSALSWSTQRLLGLCMLLGSLSGLTGIFMGGRWFRPDTSNHPLDLRYPYAYGMAGMTGVAISMWAYFITILLHSTPIGTLGGGMTLVYGFMCPQMAYRFGHQIIVRTRMRNVLTRRAIRNRDGEQEPLP